MRYYPLYPVVISAWDTELSYPPVISNCHTHTGYPAVIPVSGRPGTVSFPIYFSLILWYTRARLHINSPPRTLLQFPWLNPFTCRGEGIE